MHSGTPASDSNGDSELPAIVVIVDDAPHLRGSMDSLFRSAGLRTRICGSLQDLLDGPMPEGNYCLMADVRMR